MSSRRSGSRGLLLIAAFKLVKGLALIGVGVGAVKLLHRDVASVVEGWVNAFRVDPQNHYIHLLLAKLSLMNDKRLKELSVGTFIYAAVFLTEGTGLAFRKRWAEYFTIITTGSFLPLEVYELVRRATVPRGVTLIINVAVVVYLVLELKRHPPA
ncbi:MAG TPA: DUF2127 domain-containing protein [Candidatus Methylomirabilis sp.]|nr:DUF2127 domain-containing protein [Candidatus Methylomirabilis sp.]